MPSGIPLLSVWDQAAHHADLTLTLPGGGPMFFRRIPAGSFHMGSRGAYPEEEPPHRVVITRDFFLGTFVVTQEQYRAVAMRCLALKEKSDPSNFKGPRRPVETVSWLDATAFCEWLTGWNGLPPEIGAARLPTEAEWEYACRAGSLTDYYSGDGETALAEVAWYRENAGSETHSVDERREAHPFGLQGMHGNVWEWCQDAWDAAAYRKCVDGVDDPEIAAKPNDGQLRVLRGGSWCYSALGCRATLRFGFRPNVRDRNCGFRVRLVRSPAAGSGAGAA